MKFCVVALPRSRTAWLARWLCVEHEPLSRIGSLDELPDGVVDTASALFFPAIYKRWPDARYLFVFRDFPEIRKSAQKVGITTTGLPELAQRQLDAYHAVCWRDNVRAVRFEQLSDLQTLCSVWTHLTREPFSAVRAKRMCGENIQCDPTALCKSVDIARFKKLLQESRP